MRGKLAGAKLNGGHFAAQFVMGYDEEGYDPTGSLTVRFLLIAACCPASAALRLLAAPQWTSGWKLTQTNPELVDDDKGLK
jgi:hypothetical protein